MAFLCVATLTQQSTQDSSFDTNNRLNNNANIQQYKTIYIKVNITKQLIAVNFIFIIIITFNVIIILYSYWMFYFHKKH